MEHVNPKSVEYGQKGRKPKKSLEDKETLTKLKKENRRKKQEKRRRLIVRNLSFEIDENELKDIFSQYGDITEVKIPKRPDGKKRGFAFVQYEKFNSSVHAIKNLNYKELHGRPVAIDYAVPKSKYEHLMSSRKVTSSQPLEDEKMAKNDTESDSDLPEIEESEVQAPEELFSKVETSSGKDKKVSNFLKELDFKDESDEEAEKDDEKVSEESDSSDDDSDEEYSETSPRNKSSNRENQSTKHVGSNEDSPKKISSPEQKTLADDTHERRTVFIRNISFDTTQEDLKEALSEFGPLKYCLLCIDPITEHSKGTGFAKFEDESDAKKLIDKSSDDTGEGIYLHSRKLYCSLALSRKEVQENACSNMKQKKDKRNLRLLKEGLIMSNSPEAESISQSDMAKRAKLELVKNQKLKSLNFFVSDTRLAVHNLPKNYSDKELRKLFQGAVGRKAVITEARVMRDMIKINEKGEPTSRGFGFVAFNQNEDALKALHRINNRPDVFTPQKRPIVEFSVESHHALLTKQRRRERNKFRNKRKENTGQEVSSDPKAENQERYSPDQQNMQHKNKKRRKGGKGVTQNVHSDKKAVNRYNQQQQQLSTMAKGQKMTRRKKEFQSMQSKQLVKTDGSKKNKQAQRKEKRKGIAKNDEGFRTLVSQYKDKLLSKMK